MRTKVEVRVIAAGGKFLGNDIGGAEVVVRDALTGALLASGRVAGGSGNVDEIMGEPLTWGEPVPIDQSSVFAFEVDLAQPRLLDVAATGPLGSLQSARRVTLQQWVAPGMDLTGDQGVQVVIPGQLVEILSPPTHTSLKTPGDVTITANVAMMCGCPIQPPDAAGPTVWWPAAQFEVTAIVYDVSGGAPVEVDRLAMGCVGTSLFATTWPMPDYGFYEIAVVCRDLQNASTGVDRATVFSQPST
jgi:hypothetical protein